MDDSKHTEWRVPAERMDELNENIVGSVGVSTPTLLVGQLPHESRQALESLNRIGQIKQCSLFLQR